MNDTYLADLLDQVVTAEPLPAWGDVLGRAQRTRRRYALAAVALAALVLGARLLGRSHMRFTAQLRAPQSPPRWPG